MKNIKRMIHMLLAGLVLAGGMLAAVPDAHAATEETIAAQMEIVEKNTTLKSNHTVTSDFKVLKGTLDLSRKTLTVSGDFYLEGGAVKLNGGTLNVAGNMYVSSDLYVSHGKVNVEGKLIQTAGNIDLGMGSLNVKDDYYIAIPKTNTDGELIWDSSRGELVMRNVPDTVTIGGDFYMDASYGMACRAGTMTVSGNFTQRSDYSPQKFRATNTHKVVLNGTEPQTVTLENPGSTFAKLEVNNSTGIIVTDHFAAAELTSKSGEVKIRSDSAIFQGVGLNVPLVTVTGDLVQNGDLKLKYYTLKIDGDLTHTDGETFVDWGVLDIAGNYYIATPETDEAGETSWSGSHGALNMQYPRATVNVGGDFYMDAAEATDLTAGTLTVAGDFTQAVDHTAKQFLASKTHKVVFNGTEPQTVTLENAASSFAVLEISNSAGIIVTDHLSAGKLTSSNAEVKIQSDSAVFEDVALGVSQVTVTGDLTQDGNLDLAYHTLKIDGNLIQTSGEIAVGTGTLDVSGDYYIATPEIGEAGETIWTSSYGKLTMLLPNATVKVGGDLYVDSVGEMKCIAGTLTVTGTVTNVANPSVISAIETAPDTILPEQNLIALSIFTSQSRQIAQSFASTNMVWIPRTGDKYHSSSNCSNMDNPTQVTLEQAQAQGFEKCSKCY